MVDSNFGYNPRHSQQQHRTSAIPLPRGAIPGQTISIPAIQPYQQLEKDTSLPVTIWTRIADRYRFGKQLLVGCGLFGVIVVMLIVLGTLDVFHNHRYRNTLGISIGTTKYEGDSWGTVSYDAFNLSGKGDGTYYDPGVGVLACGTSFTAQDMVVALNYVDYGQYANPNESPVCGTCIVVTGPLGSAKATIQDKCPGCGRGSLDLSPAVYGEVGDFIEGRIPVSWTPCS